jgi:hypothetical protein
MRKGYHLNRYLQLKGRKWRIKITMTGCPKSPVGR